MLAANDGVVLRYADRIETGVVGHLAYPDVPANLRDQPTLVLHLDAPAAGEGAFELSYLTRGLAWKADYVANLTADGTAMDLNGWVTLTNASGIAYRGALVQLVAGEVNQVADAMPAPPMARGMVMAAEAADAPGGVLRPVPPLHPAAGRRTSATTRPSRWRCSRPRGSR